MGHAVQAAQPDPQGQLTAIHRPQQLTDRGQRLGFGSRGWIRVPIRTPTGARPTIGSPIRRSTGPSSMHHILAATTDINIDRHTTTTH